MAFTSPSISRQTHFIVLTLPLHIPLLFGMFPFLIPPTFLPPLLAFYFRLLPYLSISLPIIPSSLFLLPSLSMDNSSVLLRAAVCLPAYCDFHWDSFRDHSHLDWELEPRLQREINHTHLILTRIHEHTYTQKTFNFALFSPPKYSDFFVLTVFYFKLSDMHTCLFMHHTF